jgi:hypothetical protein
MTERQRFFFGVATPERYPELWKRLTEQFGPKRVEMAADGFQPVSIGPRTLRVDTACTALLAVVHASMQGR